MSSNGSHQGRPRAPVCPPVAPPPSRPESGVGSSAVSGRETPSLWGHAERSCGSREPGTVGVAGDSTRGDRWQDRDGSIGGASSITWRTAGTVGSIARARAPPTSPMPSGCWRPGWPNGRARPARARSRLTTSPRGAFRPGTRRASPVARCVLCLRAAGSTPPMEPDASASVRQSLLPSPPTVGLGPRHLRFSRHPRRSLALRPGHSLAIPWMTWSIGFSSVGFPSGCYPSYGALALTPVGLTPTEHTCLIWTHPSGRAGSAEILPPTVEQSATGTRAARDRQVGQLPCRPSGRHAFGHP